MESDQTFLNPSTLFDLKAELHKSYESLRRAKVARSFDNTKNHTPFRRKGESVSKEKKSATIKIKPVEKNGEEELALRKSRSVLEAKAKLYEKMTSTNELMDEEESERYLVDFNRKVLYETPVPASREKTEEPPSKSVDEAISAIYNTPYQKDPDLKNSESSTNCDEKETEKISEDEAIHYQNVQFNEVRDHGTGYFAFSTDESKRKEQMEELKRMRQETENQRLLNQKLKEKRKAMLEARLAKVCERRNIDKSVIQEYIGKPEPEIPEEQVQNVDLSSIPLPPTPEVKEEKKVKVRPWDIGKTDFPAFVPEKKKIRTQKEWVEERRLDRPSEFAPPSMYK